MSYESDLAYYTAQRAANEASRLRGEVADMRAEQERNEFNRWKYDSPDDEWIEKKFNHVNKNIDVLFDFMAEQRAENKGLRHDLTRVEEAVVEIKDTQTKQGKALILLGIHDKVQTWNRMLQGNEDSPALPDIAAGLHELMGLFQHLPSSLILQGYVDVLEKTDTPLARITETLHFLDAKSALFHNEMTQLLDLKAEALNPAAIIDARRRDEMIMKPYTDRVLDEEWRENLKKWLVAQIEQDVRVVQAYPYYFSPKKEIVQDQQSEEQQDALYQHIQTVRALSKNTEKSSLEIEYFQWFTWAYNRQDTDYSQRINLTRNMVQEKIAEFCPEHQAHPKFVSMSHDIFNSVVPESEDCGGTAPDKDTAYYFYILENLKLFGEMSDFQALRRDLNYFSHLKRFIDNKQLDPNAIPRLVDNLCIDRNFYTNLRMLEVALDVKDPDNADMAPFAKGLYRGILARLGDLCHDAGLAFALPKNLEEQIASEQAMPEQAPVSPVTAQCTIDTQTPSILTFQAGLSGSPLERALCLVPDLGPATINTPDGIKDFNDRCLTARPLIELTSLPATPEELLALAREAMHLQKPDGTVPQLDLLPFALRINMIMTGMFTPYTNTDGLHESRWTTMTKTEKPTVEQLLALEVNVISGELYWTDGMTVLPNTAKWHEKGRTELEKKCSRDDNIVAGYLQTTDEYKFEMDCTARELQMQKTALAM